MRRLSKAQWQVLQASIAYTPGKLLDFAARAVGARSDSDLARKLSADSGRISKVRARLEVVPPSLFVDILDACPGATIEQLRALAGYPKGLSDG